MVKRTISLNKKTCIVCEKEFQPASGAQMTCSPECKAEAKAKGLTKRGPRIPREDDPSPAEVLEAREPLPRSRRDGSQAFFNGKPVEAPEGNGGASRSLPRIPPEEPYALELDLTPLEKYIKFQVEHAVHQILRHGLTEAVQEALATKIQQAVREELAVAFKGFMGR